MPFPCNGILLMQGNLPRVIQVVLQMYRNIMLVFPSPISMFFEGWPGFQFFTYFDKCGQSHVTTKIMHQKIKRGKRYFFTNYYNQMISIHLVRILPFPAIISLLVCFPTLKLHVNIAQTYKNQQNVNYLVAHTHARTHTHT